MDLDDTFPLSTAIKYSLFTKALTSYRAPVTKNESSEEYKGRQIATNHWVLSRLFIMVEETRNVELSVVKVEKQTDD